MKYKIIEKDKFQIVGVKEHTTVKMGRTQRKYLYFGKRSTKVALIISYTN